MNPRVVSANDEKSPGKDRRLATSQTPQHSNLRRGDLKTFLEEFSIKEEELEPRPLESFQTPGVPEDVQRMRFERYEAKRKEKVRLLQQALSQDRPSQRGFNHSKARLSSAACVPHQEFNNKSFSVSRYRQPDLTYLAEKEGKKLEKHMKMRQNLESKTLEEVRKIEEMIEKRSAREAARLQNMSLKQVKKKEKIQRREHDWRQKKEVTKLCKVKGQLESMRQSQEHCYEIEAKIAEQKDAELDKSRKMYETYIQKMQKSAANYYVSLKQQRESSAEVEKRLAAYQDRMQKSEKIAGRRKKEIAETASISVRRATTKRAAHHKIDANLSPEQVSRMLKRYQRMDDLARKKQDLIKEQRKRRRDDCLCNFTKLAESREKQQKADEERRLGVLKRREMKDRKAQSRQRQMCEQRVGHIEQSRAHMLEVRRNVSMLRSEEEAIRKELRERELARDQELEAQRMQNKQLEAIKGQVALQIKTHQLRKVENPYALVEERKITTTEGRKRLQHQQSRGSNAGMAASFPSA